MVKLQIFSLAAFLCLFVFASSAKFNSVQRLKCKYCLNFFFVVAVVAVVGACCFASVYRLFAAQTSTRLDLCVRTFTKAKKAGATSNR